MRHGLFILFILFAAIACRERYELPAEPSLSSALVVEGNILRGDTTIVKLTRVSAVSELSVRPEIGASVTVEGEDNSRYNLSESEAGVYKVAPIDLNSSVKYRLRIAAAGKEYESDWRPVTNTPEIDSIYWVRDNGVEIFVQSSGGDGDTRYYKWDYDEVWDFYSITTSTMFYNITPSSSGQPFLVCDSVEVNGVMYEKCIEEYSVSRGDVFNDSMYHCWKYNTSERIHIGTTVNLSDNMMLAPVRKIEEAGFELANLYSILVKQTGLSREAYEFYKILAANSESMGTIFDAQPSQLKTNLRCVSDVDERAIGFIDATSVSTKRLFIKREDVSGWGYSPFAECIFSLDTIGDTSPSMIDRLIKEKLIPVQVKKRELDPPNRVTEFLIMNEFCMDCRIRGVHLKPDFWPY